MPTLRPPWSATTSCDGRPLSPFDALVSTHNLEHFHEADRAFERMVSMLAPGGKLYVQVPDQTDQCVPRPSGRLRGKPTMGLRLFED